VRSRGSANVRIPKEVPRYAIKLGHPVGRSVAWCLSAGHAGIVTAADSDVVIKPRRWGLIVMVAWIGFLCFLMVVGAVNEHDPRGLWLVFVWLPWLVPVALMARSRVVAAGDTLTCRGPLRTRVWRRAEIECFAITPSWWSPRVSGVEMRLAAGGQITLPLTGTSRLRGGVQQQRWFSQLEAWLSGAGQQLD
jgi:hypothetical protein